MPGVHEFGQADFRTRPLPVKNVVNASAKTCKDSKKGDMTLLLYSPSFKLMRGRSSDEYCPHCDNHYVLEAKTAKPTLNIEGEDARIDARMLKDDRSKLEQPRSIFDVKDAPERLG